ncbi:unnamed protein product, partial [Onchocerca flexuosa]|uniref:Ovule protein n=1 Tax=Onchocerca flexuosa TaxID=387005 RepID=A0A183GYY9_9BILA
GSDTKDGQKSAATLKKENRNPTGGHNCGTDGLFFKRKEVNEGRELYFRARFIFSLFPSFDVHRPSIPSCLK